MKQLQLGFCSLKGYPTQSLTMPEHVGHEHYHTQRDKGGTFPSQTTET